MTTIIDENGQIHLGEPTRFPENVDELYKLIDSEEWVFTLEPPENPGPCIYWSEMKDIHVDDEKTLFGMILAEAVNGNLLTCKPKDPKEKVMVYGPGVERIKAWIEQHRRK